MKRICLLLAVLSITLGLFAQSAWQGSAAVSRFGELPSTGLYGASDSFPKNTRIKVTNLSEGKSIEITILKDLSSEPGLFLLLSPEAGHTIGMQSDEIIQVSAVVERSTGDQLVNIYADDSFNPDPDINPRANATDEEVEAIQEYYTSDTELGAQERSTALIEETPEEVPLQDIEELIEEEPIEETSPLLPELTDSTNEEFPEGEIKITPFLSEEAKLTDTLVQDLDREVALPSRESDYYQLSEELVLPEEDVLAAAEDDLVPDDPGPDESLEVLPPLDESLLEEVSPEDPEVPEVLLAEELTPAEEPLVDLETPLLEDQLVLDQPVEEEPLLELPEDDLDTLPFEDPDSVEVTLEPSEMKPPVVDDFPEEIPEESPSVVYSGELPVLSFLDPQQNYIQIGSYKSDKDIESLVAGLKTVLPIAILKTPEEPDLVKLIAGPLPEDQIGVMYYYCKGQGFRDSFIIRRRE